MDQCRRVLISLLIAATVVLLVSITLSIVLDGSFLSDDSISDSTDSSSAKLPGSTMFFFCVTLTVV